MRQETSFLRRVGLALLTASIPILVMVVLIVLQGYQWGDHTPAMGDEINYWHQAGTWVQAGFNGGYYVIDNVTAKAPFAHFFSWGFGPPVFYGMFAQLFGWPLNGVLNVNTVYFFLCVVAFVLLARLDAKRCVLLALLLAVYPALLVYLPTSMLEPIYLGGALVIAGGLYRMHGGERDWWVVLLTGAMLVLLSIMRFTWALMFWPYLYYLAPWRVWRMRAQPSPTPDAEPSDAPARTGRLQGRDIAAPFPGERRWLFSFIGMVVLAAFFYITYDFTTSPYRYALSLIFGMVRTEPINAFWHYVNMVAENVLWFLVPSHLPSVALRFVSVGLLVWSMLRRGKARTRNQREAYTLILYIMLSTFLLAFFAYTTMRSVGFRFFAPYVLMCLALCIAWGQDAPETSDAAKPKLGTVMTFLRGLSVVQASILIFALTVPLVFTGLDTIKEHAFKPGRAAQVEAYRQEWHDIGVQYVAGADPWCNTLAHSIAYLGDIVDQDRFLALDPGMGLSIIWWEPDQPQRARYLMLDDEEYYPAYPNKDQLTRILDLAGGAVYRNEAVVCP